LKIASALYYITLASNVIVALPVFTILLETLAAIALPKKTVAPVFDIKTRAGLGVLIPAHNEEDILGDTIEELQLQLRYGDRLLVVADNCTDGTAAVAMDLGAHVIVRTDPTKRGKGFALHCGIRHFAKDPPKIVIVIDADCKLRNFAIDHLVSMCGATNRPVQALYLMLGAPNATQSARIREFAWRVKNWVRPLGLNSAGLPCQLMGTGMAFPWEIIATADLASGALVEDLKLGLELAADGHPPILCADAIVTSEFPASSEGSRSQQLRWEQGHLSMMATEIPRALMKSIRSWDKNLLVLTLDAAVPPLSLLSMIVLLFFGLSVISWQIGMGSAAFLISLGNLAGLTCATTACWITAGRDLLPLKSIFLVGASTIMKIPLYCRILFRRNGSTWIRTDRRKL
jgi:cellulose synthase/poly-beta-1,6-N-acetylglucosamine synthase-like glycosyltransferase